MVLRKGQAFFVQPGNNPTDVNHLFLAESLGNVVTIEAIELGDFGGDDKIDLYLASEESESLYLFQGDDSHWNHFGVAIPLEVSVSVKDVVTIDADADGDMDFCARCTRFRYTISPPAKWWCYVKRVIVNWLGR